MRDAMKYSVIIPVYNSEKTINRCLDSLIIGLPDDAEIILIDDGSTDKSGLICSEYSAELENISYYKERNAGVSVARNFGMNKANGEYILFVDSDDYVVPSFWETIDSILSNKNPDLLQFGVLEGVENPNRKDIGDFFVGEEDKIAKKISEALRSNNFFSLWSRIYKKSIIDSIELRFNPLLSIGEDTLFVFSYAMAIKSFAAVSVTLYVVDTGNENSLSRKKKDDLKLQLMKVNRLMYSQLLNCEWSQKSKNIIEGAVAWTYYRSAYSSIKELRKYSYPLLVRLQKIRKICDLYSDKMLRPHDIRCFIISVPITLHIAWIIDIII